jgi:glycosyltransferase involved in cell wall biosynthesis
MRIAIVSLTYQGLSGGGRKYLQRIVPHLRADPRTTSLELFVPPRLAGELEGLTPAPQAWPEMDPLLSRRWLKARLRRLAPEAVLITTARWLGCAPAATVVMVRNMEAMVASFAGNPLCEKLRNAFLAWESRRACQRADRVIAVSHFVRDYLLNRWKLPAEKVEVVYHGGESPSNGSLSKPPWALERLGDRPFVFTAGSVRPYRGYEDAIGALAALPEQAGVKLVIAGKTTEGLRSYGRRLEQMAARLGVTGQVIWAGELGGKEMEWCFRHCGAFVMTSRVEACPNVVLEAMACGCRIVSTALPPMPELMGQAATYYRGGDPVDLANKLQGVLSGMEQPQARRQLPLERAAAFRWSQTARQTMDSLERAVAARRKRCEACPDAGALE